MRHDTPEPSLEDPRDEPQDEFTCAHCGEHCLWEPRLWIDNKPICSGGCFLGYREAKP